MMTQHNHWQALYRQGLLKRNRRIAKWAAAGVSYAEIGRRLGLSRERVRQIHTAADKPLA